MKRDGVIKGADIDAWMQLIEDREDLAPEPPRIGSNPFTDDKTEFPAPPGHAVLTIDGQVAANLRANTDGSDFVIDVTAQQDAAIPVAQSIAAALGGELLANDDDECEANERSSDATEDLMETLPEDYREFLEEEDGCVFEAGELPFTYKEFGDVTSNAAMALYSLNEVRQRRLEFNQVHAGAVETVEDVGDVDMSHVIPIGADGCANDICLVIDGDHCGTIIFACHDPEGLFHVADSFSDCFDA